MAELILGEVHMEITQSTDINQACNQLLLDIETISLFTEEEDAALNGKIKLTKEILESCIQKCLDKKNFSYANSLSALFAELD